jgi:hypothetical protein
LQPSEALDAIGRSGDEKGFRWSESCQRCYSAGRKRNAKPFTFLKRQSDGHHRHFREANPTRPEQLQPASHRRFEP